MSSGITTKSCVWYTVKGPGVAYLFPRPFAILQFYHRRTIGTSLEFILMEFVYHSSNQPHVLKMYSTPHTVIDANARYKKERLYLSVLFLDSPIRITWQACLICFLMTLISKQISPVPVSQKRITPFYTNSWILKNSYLFSLFSYTS